MGNYYRIQDRDMSFIPIKDSHINLLEICCANVKENEESMDAKVGTEEQQEQQQQQQQQRDEEEKKNGVVKIDYTFGGLFPVITMEGPNYISSSSSSRRNSQPSTPITPTNKAVNNNEVKTMYKLDTYDIASPSNFEVSSVLSSPSSNKQRFDAHVVNPMKR
jgi:hypothetical protein